MHNIITPDRARICEDCENLVTIAGECPLCGKPTKEHPEAADKEHYCVGCGKGPFTVDKLHLITWSEDPYIQTEDGDLACHCLKCKRNIDRMAGEI
jgi:hypothetical protein